MRRLIKDHISTQTLSLFIFLSLMQEKYYSVELWRRMEKYPIVEESSLPLEIIGTLPKNPSLIVCCGFPGSGKSFFSDQCQSIGYERICQDLLKSRKACEKAVSAAAKSGKLIIIDRCNPLIENRCLWLSLCFNPKNTILVHFTADMETCIERANARFNHPTIEHGRAAGVVNSFAKSFEEPSLKEGFSAICKVPSFSAANELLQKLGVSISENDDNDDSGGLQDC